MTTKICPRCETEKPLMDFHANRHTKSGRQVYCKTCKTEIQRGMVEELNAYHREYRATTKYKTWYAGWRKDNRPKLLKQSVSRNAASRADALAHYGMACACCGESTPVFLAIDHVAGGGSKQRRESGRSSHGFYRWLKKSNWPIGFQTLCHNCNWAKHALGKCPHQK